MLECVNVGMFYCLNVLMWECVNVLVDIFSTASKMLNLNNPTPQRPEGTRQRDNLAERYPNLGANRLTNLHINELTHSSINELTHSS